MLNVDDFQKFNQEGLQKLEEELDEVFQNQGNPLIISFNQQLQPDETFYAWLRSFKEFAFNKRLQWILIPPFENDYQNLENEGIQFAPTTQEAVDMAYMIKIEQDFLNEDDGESSS